MSVIVVTGSAGLIGSEAVKFFCSKKFDVLGIDNNFRKMFFLVKMLQLIGIENY